jgi:hypothetical protein
LSSFRHNLVSRAFGAMKRRMAGFVWCQFSDMAHRPVARQRAQNLLSIMSTWQFPLSRRTISRRTHHTPPSPGIRLRQAIDGHHTGSRDSRQLGGPQRRATPDTGGKHSDDGALGNLLCAAPPHPGLPKCRPRISSRVPAIVRTVEPRAITPPRWPRPMHHP